MTDNAAEQRFELTVEGHRAVLDYRLDGDRLVLVHTGVPDELEGRGLGGTLVEAALARAERDGLSIVPQCAFVRGWLERHPDAAAAVTVNGPDRAT